MDHTQPSFPLFWKMLLIPTYHFIEKRYLSCWFSGINIDCLSLCFRNAAQGLDLARKVVRGWSEISKTYVRRVKRRQRSKSLHSGNPTRSGSCSQLDAWQVTRVHSPFTPVVWRHFQHPCVSEYSTIQVFHNVEGSPNDFGVLAQGIRYRNRDNLPRFGGWLGIVVVEGIQNSVFALNLMSGGGE